MKVKTVCSRLVWEIMCTMVDLCHPALDIEDVNGFVEIVLVQLFLSGHVGNKSFDELDEVGHGESFKLRYF